MLLVCNIRVRMVELEGVRARRKVVVSSLEHLCGEVSLDWLRLDVQVGEHLVQSPPSNQTEVIHVNPSANQGHGASGSERAG